MGVLAREMLEFGLMEPNKLIQVPNDFVSSVSKQLIDILTALIYVLNRASLPWVPSLSQDWVNFVINIGKIFIGIEVNQIQGELDELTGGFGSDGAGTI